MKKIATILATLLVAFCFSLSTHAQTFSWGIVGGLDMTKLKVYGSYKSFAHDVKSDNKAGWYIGPKVALNTVMGLGLDAALEYSQRDLNIECSGISQSEKYRTIEIPINVRYNIGLGRIAGVYVATGPQFGFALNNMKWDNVLTGNNFSRSNMNTTWNIGAGLRLMKHLEVGVGYNFALGRVGKALIGESANGTSDDYQLKYKTNTFQVQVAYMF